MTVEKLVYGLVLAGCVLFAQNQPPAAAPRVRLNVVALDSDNNPVGDLTANDFHITDQGRSVGIAYFRRVEESASAPAAPHEISNRAVPAAPAGGGHTTVVLFDLLNQARTNGLDAAHKVGHALAQLPSGDSLYFYILGLDGNLFPIHPFPAPGAPPADDKTWTQQADAQIQAALNKVNRARKAGMTNEDFTKKTYVALETLAKDLTAYQGERDIVWITDGVPYVFKEKDSERGCPGDWFGDCDIYLPHLSVTLAGTNTAVFPLTYTMSPDTNTSRDMDYFGSSTGGRSFAGIELGDVLAQIGGYAKGSYVIAYEPSADNWDGKSYHKIKVTCDRKGVKIQTRTRYYAVAVAEQPGPGGAPAVAAAPVPSVVKDEDAAVLAALESTVDVPGIGLNVAVAPAAGGKKAVHLTIRINVADLQMREQNGAFDDQIGVMFADYAANGLKGIPPLPQELSLHMTPEQHATMLKAGLSFGVDHAVDSTIQDVRIMVFDHASNTFGTISAPVAGVVTPVAAASPAPAAPAAH
jgi:VWFA-related protein